jgi:hypothetical protein
MYCPPGEIGVGGGGPNAGFEDLPAFVEGACPSTGVGVFDVSSGSSSSHESITFSFVLEGIAFEVEGRSMCKLDNLDSIGALTDMPRTTRFRVTLQTTSQRDHDVGF